MQMLFAVNVTGMTMSILVTVVLFILLRPLMPFLLSVVKIAFFAESINTGKMYVLA